MNNKVLLENYNRLFSESIGQDKILIDKLLSGQKVEVDFSKVGNGKPEEFIYNLIQKIKSSGKEAALSKKWLEFETDGSKVETGHNGLHGYNTGFQIKDILDKSIHEIGDHMLVVYGVGQDGDSKDAGDMGIGDLDLTWTVKL